MVDPFTLATSVAGLASFGLEVTKVLHAYVSTAKDAKASSKAILFEIKLTTSVLEDFAAHLKDEQTVSVNSRSLEIAAEAVVECKRVFDGIHRMVTGKSLPTSPTAIETDVKIPLSRKLRWPFTESKLELYRSNLEKTKATFHWLISLMTYGVVKKLGPEASQIVAKQKREVEATTWQKIGADALVQSLLEEIAQQANDTEGRSDENTPDFTTGDAGVANIGPGLIGPMNPEMEEPVKPLATATQAPVESDPQVAARDWSSVTKFEAMKMRIRFKDQTLDDALDRLYLREVEPTDRDRTWHALRLDIPHNRMNQLLNDTERECLQAVELIRDLVRESKKDKKKKKKSKDLDEPVVTEIKGAHLVSNPYSHTPQNAHQPPCVSDYYGEKRMYHDTTYPSHGESYPSRPLPMSNMPPLMDNVPQPVSIPQLVTAYESEIEYLLMDRRNLRKSPTPPFTSDLSYLASHDSHSVGASAVTSVQGSDYGDELTLERDGEMLTADELLRKFTTFYEEESGIESEALSYDDEHEG